MSGESGVLPYLVWTWSSCRVAPLHAFGPKLDLTVWSNTIRLWVPEAPLAPPRVRTTCFWNEMWDLSSLSKGEDIDVFLELFRIAKCF